MQLLSHPLTPEELQNFMLNPIAVYAEYSVSLLKLIMNCSYLIAATAFFDFITEHTFQYGDNG